MSDGDMVGILIIALLAIGELALCIWWPEWPFHHVDETQATKDKTE